MTCANPMDLLVKFLEILILASITHFNTFNFCFLKVLSNKCFNVKILLNIKNCSIDVLEKKNDKC